MKSNGSLSRIYNIYDFVTVLLGTLNDKNYHDSRCSVDYCFEKSRNLQLLDPFKLFYYCLFIYFNIFDFFSKMIYSKGKNHAICDRRFPSSTTAAMATKAWNPRHFRCVFIPMSKELNILF